MTRIVIITAAVVLMTGCSQFGSLDEGAPSQLRWQAYQQTATQFSRWDIHARVAVTLKAEAYNIGFRWQRDDQNFKLLLEAPFGQGLFRIDAVASDLYRLHLPDGRQLTQTTPEALLEEVTGWTLPIRGLDYWIRGLPGPDSDYNHRIDRAGRTRSITQDDWTVTYIDYFNPPKLVLPRRIRLERNELTVKLVIERWRRESIDASPSELFPEFN